MRPKIRMKRGCERRCERLRHRDSFETSEQSSPSAAEKCGPAKRGSGSAWKPQPSLQNPARKRPSLSCYTLPKIGHDQLNMLTFTQDKTKYWSLLSRVLLKKLWNSGQSVSLKIWTVELWHKINKWRFVLSRDLHKDIVFTRENMTLGKLTRLLQYPSSQAKSSGRTHSALKKH